MYFDTAFLVYSYCVGHSKSLQAFTRHSHCRTIAVSPKICWILDNLIGDKRNNQRPPLIWSGGFRSNELASTTSKYAKRRVSNCNANWTQVYRRILSMFLSWIVTTTAALQSTRAKYVNERMVLQCRNVRVRVHKPQYTNACASFYAKCMVLNYLWA